MSGLWSEELARARAVVGRAADRVPGGASVAAVGASSLAAGLLAAVAVAVPSAAPLYALPVLLLAAAVLPSDRQRLLLVAAGLPCAAALLALPGLWLRDVDVLAPAVGLAVALAAAAALLWLVLARQRSLETALLVARDAVDAVSVRDPLTGVANRQGLELVGRQVVETARRQGDAAHCTFVEIGGLVEARQSHGPDAVADVLVALAEALRNVTRTTDVVARWKDSVFCVVGQGAGMDPAELERRVRRRLGADSALDRAVWSGRITVGGAMLPPWDAGTLETLVVRAAEELRARGAVRRPVVEPPVPRHDPAT